MGYDYAYLLVYRPAIEIRYKAMQDLQGFGTMEIVILKDLRPSVKYHLQLQFYCGGAPYLRSKTISVEFTTLPPSKSVPRFFAKMLNNSNILLNKDAFVL